MALGKMELHNVLVNRLGAPTDAAEEIANLVGEQTDGLVTERAFREEMKQFRIEYLAEMNRLLRWMIGIGAVIGGAIIGLLITLIVQGL